MNCRIIYLCLAASICLFSDFAIGDDQRSLEQLTKLVRSDLDGNRVRFKLKPTFQISNNQLEFTWPVIDDAYLVSDPPAQMMYELIGFRQYLDASKSEHAMFWNAYLDRMWKITEAAVSNVQARDQISQRVSPFLVYQNQTRAYVGVRNDAISAFLMLKKVAMKPPVADGGGLTIKQKEKKEFLVTFVADGRWVAVDMMPLAKHRIWQLYEGKADHTFFRRELNRQVELSAGAYWVKLRDKDGNFSAEFTHDLSAGGTLRLQP